MKYKASFVEFFSKQIMFTTGDARRFLIKLGADESYIRLMLHYLVESGDLYSIGKGAYTFHRNEVAIGFKFRPFYYGLQYALTIRKIWTQQAVPVIVTTGRANPGARGIMGTRVILHRIDRARFFGFEYVNYGGVFVPVSDVEKTLIDFNYYHIKLSEETLESIRKEIDKVKLLEYEKRMIKIS